jgi:hypothetical protein
MGIFDFFRFTPPAHKKFGLYISNYLKEDEHILICYGDIIKSGCTEGLQLNYELFSKHFRAIQIQILFSCMGQVLKNKDYENFSIELIKEVKKFDSDIWKLVKYKYSDPYSFGNIEKMVEELNKKPFKQKLDNNSKTSLIYGMEIIKIQFNEVIKNFS